MLALCAALLVLTGGFVTILVFADTAERTGGARDAQPPAAPEGTDDPAEPSPADPLQENAAEELEALPAGHEPTEGLLRQNIVASCAAQSSDGWLNLETPPPRG